MRTSLLILSAIVLLAVANQAPSTRAELPNAQLAALNKQVAELKSDVHALQSQMRTLQKQFASHRHSYTMLVPTYGITTIVPCRGAAGSQCTAGSPLQVIVPNRGYGLAPQRQTAQTSGPKY
ncbi:MAG TPA: hypothetical protein VMA98_13770 [Candidatus Acidoferrales bacterium]|nr:hypothetical protein [Candidatus Acidoferrales bacterium]